MNEESNTLINSCPVCKSPTVSKDPFYYEWNNAQWWIYRCANCTHQFVNPPFTAAEQAMVYTNEYFQKDGDWACGVFAGSYQDADTSLRTEAQEILSMIPISSGRLLDIGCAGGVFLDVAQNRGFDVEGIEYNQNMALNAKKLIGPDLVIQSRIEDINHDWRVAHFDVIVLLDVLEHLPSPSELFVKISSWIKPQGYLLIRGPLVNSYTVFLKEGARRIIGKPKLLDGYPLDANCFNKKSLQILLERHGFATKQWINQSESFANLLAQKVE